MRTLKYLKKNLKFFLPTKSWKNHPQKLLRIPQIHFFSLTFLTAQMARTEEFLFQNVAFWLYIDLGPNLSKKFIQIGKIGSLDENT